MLCIFCFYSVFCLFVYCYFLFIGHLTIQLEKKHKHMHWLIYICICHLSINLSFDGMFYSIVNKSGALQNVVFVD